MIDMQKQFLIDIFANPDDDLPRMAYADWLVESGTDELYGLFMALQLRLHAVNPHYRIDSAMNSRVYSESVIEEIRDSYHLLATLMARLFRDTGSDQADRVNVSLYGLSFVWRRGMIEKVTINEWCRGPLMGLDCLKKVMAVHPMPARTVTHSNFMLVRSHALYPQGAYRLVFVNNSSVWQNYVPDFLMKRIPSECGLGRSTVRSIWGDSLAIDFASEEEAREAFSQACLSYLGWDLSNIQGEVQNGKLA